MTTSVHAARIVPELTAQTTFVGDTTSIDWSIDTEQTTVNVVDVTIQFSSDTIAFSGAQTGASAFVVWPTVPYEQSPGSIHAVAALPSGVQGKMVPLFRTTFTAKQIGDGVLTAQGTAYLSDGQGTTVSLPVSTVSIPLLPTQSKRYLFSSPTHPQQSVWYTTSRVALSFTTFPNEEYSYSFSTNKERIVDTIPETTNGTVIYPSVPDGVYYFRLASRVINGVWQEAGAYSVRIDTNPPLVESFSIAPLSRTDGVMSVFAIDKMSGIASYAVRTGWFGIYTKSSVGARIHRPWISTTIYLKVRDHAGNVTTAKTYYAPIIPLPVTLIVVSTLFILCIVRYTLQYKKRHGKKIS